MLLFFFFSSRRRHTRFDCDWSSDVCSSDLTPVAAIVAQGICAMLMTLTPFPQLVIYIGFSLTFFTDRKSTRLNFSHSQISYAVFCLKKKKQRANRTILAHLR